MMQYKEKSKIVFFPVRVLTVRGIHIHVHLPCLFLSVFFFLSFLFFLRLHFLISLRFIYILMFIFISFILPSLEQWMKIRATLKCRKIMLSSVLLLAHCLTFGRSIRGGNSFESLSNQRFCNMTLTLLVSQLVWERFSVQVAKQSCFYLILSLLPLHFMTSILDVAKNVPCSNRNKVLCSHFLFYCLFFFVHSYILRPACFARKVKVLLRIFSTFKILLTKS